MGTVFGPHPFPVMVRDFQPVIGREARKQIQAVEGKLPEYLIACVGGGSNALGLFHAFIHDGVKMVGVEAGGRGIAAGEHAARFAGGSIGVLQGTKSYLLQDDDGNVLGTHSVSAGLDYAVVGPEHAFLRDSGRVHYAYATDDEAIAAFEQLSRSEGIIPALESSHALAEAMKLAPKLSKDEIIVVNLLETRHRLDRVESVDLRRIVDESVQTAQPVARRRGITLSWGQGEPVLVEGDAFLLQRAVSNLIENAIDFSDDGGVVDIALQCASANVEVHIRDHCAGIPEYAHARLFEKFFSLARPHSNKKSSGLGLAFVREVAQLHHGRVSLQNADQRGAIATLRLPRC